MCPCFHQNKHYQRLELSILEHPPPLYFPIQRGSPSLTKNHQLCQISPWNPLLAWECFCCALNSTPSRSLVIWCLLLSHVETDCFKTNVRLPPYPHSSGLPGANGSQRMAVLSKSVPQYCRRFSNFTKFWQSECSSRFHICGFSLNNLSMVYTQPSGGRDKGIFNLRPPWETCEIPILIYQSSWK